MYINESMYFKYIYKTIVMIPEDCKNSIPSGLIGVYESWKTKITVIKTVVIVQKYWGAEHENHHLFGKCACADDG